MKVNLNSKFFEEFSYDEDHSDVELVESMEIYHGGKPEPIGRIIGVSLVDDSVFLAYRYDDDQTEAFASWELAYKFIRRYD